MPPDWPAVLGAIQRRGDLRPLGEALAASGGRVPTAWIEVLGTALAGIQRPSRAEIQRRALAAYRVLRRRGLSVSAAAEVIRSDFGLSLEEAATVARGGIVGYRRKRRRTIPVTSRETPRGAGVMARNR